MQNIYIQPIGKIEKELLDFLSAKLEKIYGYPCRIATTSRVPESSFDAHRDQYNAEAMLSGIGMPSNAKKLLCVVDADLFVHGLNFVFGLASRDAAIISLTRLRPEYYGLKKNESLFRDRAIKEAVHELGHTFGLMHCPDKKCVMHFSNMLEDTDIKGPGLCQLCFLHLKG